MKVGKRLEMGRKELEKVGVISVVCEGRRSQREAALELELSVRQVKRLVQRYQGQGAKGLISGHRIPEAVQAGSSWFVSSDAPRAKICCFRGVGT